MKQLFRTLLVLAVGLFISYRIIHCVDHEFVFDLAINFGLLIFTLCVFIWVFFKDKLEYAKSRNWTAFTPTFIGIFIVVILLITIFLLNQRDSSPSKLYCVTKVVDFNGASIDFREDGTYKLTIWCLGADYYRGTYTLSDSIITLDKSSIENIVESNRLLIRQDGELDSLGNREQSIYQIDNHGQMFPNAVEFRVLNKPPKVDLRHTNQTDNNTDNFYIIKNVTSKSISLDSTTSNSLFKQKIIATIMNLKEVKEATEYVGQQTKGKRYLFAWIVDTPRLPNQKYYWVKVGEDNGVSFVTHFNFYFYPYSMKILYYDIENDTLLTLAEWRKKKDIW